MTVNIKKPAIQLREELAKANKPTGIAGEALLRADSVQDARDLIGAGRKNLIINGDMRISQRGTSQAATGASGYFTTDRHYFGGGSSKTITREEVTDLNGFEFCSKVALTSASYCNIAQRNEELRPLLGKTVTYSFYAKASSNQIWGFQANFRNSAGSSIAYEDAPTAFSVTTSWQRFEYTFTMPSYSASYDVGSWYDVMIIQNPAVAHDIYITGFQLELGSVATDFEHRSYGEELALCQRYYWKKFPAASNHPICTINGEGSTTAVGHMQFPITMRATPAMTYSMGLKVNADTTYTLASLSYFAINPHGVGILATCTAAVTAGAGGQVRTSDTSGYVAFDAEL